MRHHLYDIRISLLILLALLVGLGVAWGEEVKMDENAIYFTQE